MSEDTLENFPSDIYNDLNDIPGLPTPVKNVLLDAQDVVADETDLAEAYSDFREFVDELDISTHTPMQQQMIASVLYAQDILLNWLLNDELITLNEFVNEKEDVQLRWGIRRRTYVV